MMLGRNDAQCEGTHMTPQEWYMYGSTWYVVSGIYCEYW